MIETTESTTNRIDLDSISAALTAAGWTEHHDHHWGEGTHRYGRDDRRIQFGTVAAPWLDVEYKQTIPADVLRAVGESLIAAADERNGGQS